MRSWSHFCNDTFLMVCLLMTSCTSPRFCASFVRLHISRIDLVGALLICTRFLLRNMGRLRRCVFWPSSVMLSKSISRMQHAMLCDKRGLGMPPHRFTYRMHIPSTCACFPCTSKSESRPFGVHVKKQRLLQRLYPIRLQCVSRPSTCRPHSLA